MKNAKKVFSVCTVLFVLIVSFVLLAPKTRALGIVDSGTCGEKLTWKLDNIGTLTISGTGEMYCWSYNEMPWYEHRADIGSVIIESGVTSIGDTAFRECRWLWEVTIPDSVSSIGNYAFYGCSHLSSITIPEGVASIGWGVFGGCSGLDDITIPASVVRIEKGAFAYCEALKSVVYKGTGKQWHRLYIGAENEAFVNAELTFVGNKTCGKSVTYELDDKGMLIISGVGPMTNYRDSSPWGDAVKVAIIEEGVTSIGSYAFASCDNMINVKIPESVIYVGDYAFAWCKKLKNIRFPDAVTTIGSRAFLSCNSLQGLILGEGITQIGGDEGWPTFLEYICIGSRVEKLKYRCYAKKVLFAGDEYQWSYIGGWPSDEYTTVVYNHRHSYNRLSSTSATCTDWGKTTYSCPTGDGFTSYSPQLGHKAIEIPLCEPTCTEEGINKSGTMCDRCKEVLVAPSYVPALGHNYVAGFCARCGIREALPGDMTGNFSVNNDDVVLLLWHTLFPEDYPLGVSGDINKDGSVNNDDVVLLLWHTLFPEDYPL